MMPLAQLALLYNSEDLCCYIQFCTRELTQDEILFQGYSPAVETLSPISLKGAGVVVYRNTAVNSSRNRVSLVS